MWGKRLAATEARFQKATLGGVGMVRAAPEPTEFRSLEQDPAPSIFQIRDPTWVCPQFDPAQVELPEMAHASHAVRQCTQVCRSEVQMG